MALEHHHHDDGPSLGGAINLVVLVLIVVVAFVLLFNLLPAQPQERDIDINIRTLLEALPG